MSIFLAPVRLTFIVIESRIQVQLFATSWPVAHQASLSSTISCNLLKFMSVESVIPSNHLTLCHPLFLLPSIFPSIRSFPLTWFFASSGQSIGASASVLPMNIQGWFPLGLTGLISMQSKGLSRGLSSTTTRKHKFSGAPYGPALKSVHVCGENYSFDHTDICWQSDISAF